MTQPSHGSATITADNSVTYTPSANFNGSDRFAYPVSDGRGGRDTATVSVMVHAGNAPPVASAQSVTTAPGTPVVITLHATEAENEPLSYEVVTDRLGLREDSFPAKHDLAPGRTQPISYC